MLTKIHHIGVAVQHADNLLPLYRDALGLKVTKDAVLDAQGVRGVLLAAGETEIELLEPLRPESAVGRFLQSRGEGLHHLCFETDDIEAEIATVRARGLPLIDERPRQGIAGMIAFLHPKATQGVLVEYAQPPAGSRPISSDGAVRAFDHLAVAVTDLDSAAKTYRRNFDLSERGRRETPVLGIRNVSLPIGDAWIGLVAPLSEGNPVDMFIRKRGEGLYLISLSVGALDALLAELRGRGLRCTDPVVPRDGSRLAFVAPSGTHGVLIQLIEQAS